MAPPRPPKKPTHPNPILQSLLRLEFMQHADPDEATRLNLQAIDDFRAFSEIVRDAEGGAVKSSWMEFSAANDNDAMAELGATSRLEFASNRLRKRPAVHADNANIELGAKHADAVVRATYKGAALPYEPRPGELFLAGKVRPGYAPRKRGVAHIEPRTNREALGLLAGLRAALTDELYDALYLAIAGLAFQIIIQAAQRATTPADAVVHRIINIAFGIQ